MHVECRQLSARFRRSTVDREANEMLSICGVHRAEQVEARLRVAIPREARACAGQRGCAPRQGKEQEDQQSDWSVRLGPGGFGRYEV